MAKGNEARDIAVALGVFALVTLIGTLVLLAGWSVVDWWRWQ